MTATPLRINLATRPLRNRRIFLWAAAALAAGLAVSAAAGGYFFIRYETEGRRARREAEQLAQRTREARSETIRLTRETERAGKELREDVDLLNAAIRRKVFSWIRLLGEIEAALPGDSILVSFQPGLPDERGVALRIDVASASMDGLLAFLRGLAAGRFSGIRVDSESPGAGGRLVTPITLHYDQNR